MSSEQSYSYDWDPDKAAHNLKRHQVTFLQAIDALSDPMAVFLNDDPHSQDEVRQWCIGMAEPGILVVAFTMREGNIYRIITAWKANGRERNLYYEKQT